MTGDVGGLRAAYLEVVAAIQTRTLPAADLATRVRLSKTPEAYQESRVGHREAAYEALLAAGRNDLQLGMFDQPIDGIQPQWIRCDVQPL
jgi:DNA polymerase, archaea type